MESLADNLIYEHLKELDLPINKPPYTKIQNNNHAITDNSTFFLKYNTNPRGLELEIETINHLPQIKQLLQPILTVLNSYTILITKYVPHIKLNPNNITPKQVEQTIQQIRTINSLQANQYTHPRNLTETHTLIEQRLANPNLTLEHKQKLQTLIKEYINPYIEKHADSKTLTHTDVKLDNILQTPNALILIDYESIKPSPPETDLASLYQDLYQTGHIATYNQFEQEWIKQYRSLNPTYLKESILFKNTLTTTAAIKLEKPSILNYRIQALLENMQTHTPPSILPKPW